MVTQTFIFELTLTNGVKVKLCSARKCLCTVSYTLGMYIGSLWVLTFFIGLLTLKGPSQGQRSRSKSLGLVTHQIKATVTWNMMVTKVVIFGPNLTNGSSLKCLKLPLYGLANIRYAYKKSVGIEMFLLILKGQITQNQKLL